MKMRLTKLNLLLATLFFVGIQIASAQTPTLRTISTQLDGQAPGANDDNATNRAPNGTVTYTGGAGTVAGDFSTESSSSTTASSGLFDGCSSDLLDETGVVEICVVNFQNITNNSGADLAGTQIAISINGGGPIAFLSNGSAFGAGGSMDIGPVTMCFTNEALGAGPDNSGQSLGIFFNGVPANNLSIALIASDGFGTGDVYSYDEISITINDEICMCTPSTPIFVPNDPTEN